MKQRLFLLLLTLCAAFPMMAQFTPQGFNYQSIVRDDATGVALTNKTLTLLFTVRTGSPNGQTVYSEKQSSSTNEFGLVNLIVGAGTPIFSTFDAINWGGGAKYLTVSIQNPNDPTVFNELGSSQLMSVPYALYAKEAANTGGDNWGTQSAATNNTLKGDGTTASPLGLAQQDATPGQVLKWNGTQWAPAPDAGSGGTVTEINTGTGLNGGPITGSGTISLSNTGVAAGTYGSKTLIPVLSIDAQGRVTSVSTQAVEVATFSGGAGIDIQQTGSNYTITNIGDPNAGDDLTNATNFSGDVTGPFFDLQLRPNVVTSAELLDNSVTTGDIQDNTITAQDLANNAVTEAKLAPNSVTSEKIAGMSATPGQVLKWTGGAWLPAADNSGTTLNLSSGTGINITGVAPNLTIANTGDTDPTDDLTTATAFNGDVSGPAGNLQLKTAVVTNLELAPNAVETANLANKAVTGAKLDDMSATTGQVLKWNGATWAPASDAVGPNFQVLPGTGIDVTQSGNSFIVINSGDVDATDDLTALSTFNGDVSGTYNNLQLKPLSVTSTELAPNSVTTTSIINGAITAAKLNNMGAADGQVLKFISGAWTPANDNTGGGTGGSNYAAGPGISITGTAPNQTINNTGDINAADDITNTSTAGGDLSGTFADLQVKADVITTTELADNAVATANVAAGAITGAKISQMSATPGQVLKWDGSTWKPDTDLAGGGGLNISAGPGISITGTAPNITVNNTGDTNGADDVLITTGADGDLGGVFQNLQIKAGAVGTLELGAQAVTAAKLDQMGASDGQVLRWNQNIFSWQPATINATGDNWGTQTVVTAPTLSGTGVTGSPLTIAQQGALGGQVLKWDAATTSWKPGNDEVGTGGGTNNNYTAGPGISITGTAPNFVINNIGDADASPTNEIQALSIAGNQLSLSQGGGTVTLPGGTNYLAGTGINFSGTAPTITINNGGDLSTTNEIQTLALSGNELSLSQGGGTVTLPGANTYTAGPGISITGTAPNLTINNTGDTDNSPTNELQTLSLTGPVLTISGSNSSVDFTPLLGGAGNFWQLNTNDIFNLNTGSVVIGGAAPAPSEAKFQVMSSGPAEAAIITQTGSEAALMVQHTGNGPAAFFNSQNGNALITAEGNVGIHTKSPVTRLHVEGEGLFRSSTALPQMGLENSASGFARLSLKNQSSAGRWNVQGRTAGSSEFSIEYSSGTKSGKVLTAVPDSGIVLGSPAQTATLRAFTGNDGFFLENSNNGHSWEFLVTNTNAATSGQLSLYNDQFGFGIPAGTFAINGLYQPSDRRLKKDVSLLSAGVLDKLLRLQAVTYRYQSEQDNAPRSLGFMAQDVQPLFPELVNQTTSRDGKGDFLSLNYAGFGVLAVKAVQEQQAQIKTLQQEKDQLQQQVQSLESRLQKLEQLLIEKK